VHSTRFEVAPNTLVLCLKRFGTGRFGKINKVLVYGERLDLGPFMAPGAMDDGLTTYTLTGVVVHLDQVRPGTAGSHTTATPAWPSTDRPGTAPPYRARDCICVSRLSQGCVCQ
jgi:hypothetical protein